MYKMKFKKTSRNLTGAINVTQDYIGKLLLF
jgi:hypothetical protein